MIVDAGMKVAGGCFLVDWCSVNLFKHESSIIMWLTLKFRIEHYTAMILKISGSPEWKSVNLLFLTFYFCRDIVGQ